MLSGWWRTVLARWIVFALLPRVLVSGPEMAVAQGPAEPDSLTIAGPMRVPRNGRYELACTISEVRALFYGQSNAGGPQGGSGVWSGGGLYYGARLRYEQTRVEVVPSIIGIPAQSFVEDGRIYEGNMFRLVLGVWEGTADCRPTVSGDEVVLTPWPTTAAVFLDEDAFASGASTSTLGLNTVVDARFERQSRGFLWVFLATSRGSTRVEGPDGGVYGGSGTVESWVALARTSDGRWIYEIDYATSPHLFIVETP